LQVSVQLASDWLAGYKFCMPRLKNSAVKRGKSSSTAPVRKRLTPELRKQQILEAAARLTVMQGYLPLAIERLAQEAGASKALIYTYFPTQYDIANALLVRERENLKVAGIEAAIGVNDIDQALLIAAMLYFEHVARHGPLLHILTSDLYLAGRLDDSLIAAGDDVMRQLASAARQSITLPEAELRAGIDLLRSVPEECGSLAYYKDLDVRVGRQLCHTLMLSCLDGLRSCSTGLARTRDRS